MRCSTGVISGKCLLAGRGTRIVGSLSVHGVRVAFSKSRKVRGRQETLLKNRPACEAVVSGLGCLLDIGPRVAVSVEAGVSEQGGSSCGAFCGTFGTRVSSGHIAVCPNFISSLLSSRYISPRRGVDRKKCGTRFILSVFSGCKVRVGSFLPGCEERDYITDGCFTFIVNPSNRVCGY